MNGVRLEPWKFGAKAAVCFSADFELAWAARHVSLERALAEAQRTRDAFPRLLASFDSFEVPVTWAVVGHLLLDACARDPSTGRAHPEMPRPGPYANRYWTFDRGDWYDHDPCTSAIEAPEWYAPDLIRKIIASPVPHEIGCHSFSHTDFSDNRCPPSLATAELEACHREARWLGRRLRSFVFPANFPGNFGALAACGFISFRGPPRWDLTYPAKEQGLWNIPGSLQLFDPEVDYMNRLPRYLGAGARAGSAVHLNFHPSLLDVRMIDETLAPTLRLVKERERTGDAWIATMDQIASFCETRGRAVVRTESGGGASRRFDIEWPSGGADYPEPSLTLSVPWTGSLPSCEIDGSEVPSSSPDCFVRDGLLFLTLSRPQKVAAIRSR